MKPGDARGTKAVPLPDHLSIRGGTAGLLEIDARCSCGAVTELAVKHGELTGWIVNQGLCQDYFPDLSDDLREALISGTCSKCWETLFGGDG